MYKSGLVSLKSFIIIIIALLIGLDLDLDLQVSHGRGSALAFAFIGSDAQLNCSSLCRCDILSTHQVLNRHLQRHQSFMGAKFREDFEYVSTYTDFLGFYLLMVTEIVEIKCSLSDGRLTALSTLLNGVEYLRYVSLDVDCRHKEKILWDVPTWQVSVNVFFGRNCGIVAVDDNKGIVIPMNMWIFDVESGDVDLLYRINTRYTMNTIALSVTGTMSQEIPKSLKGYYMISAANINLQSNELKDYKCELTFTKQVDTINLDRNSFTKFPSCFLQEHRKGLRFLSLAHNSISDISPLFEDTTTVSVIHIIDLSNNLISKIGTFQTFSRLSVLDLSGNLITEINDDAFHNLVDLEQLHLQNNRIHYVGSVAFRNNGNLIKLNLNSNALKFVRQEQFPVSANGLLLDLRKNKLHFPPFAGCADKKTMRSGIKVLSTSNPYHCNCAMIRMEECVNFLNSRKNNHSDASDVYLDIHLLKCASPPENKGKLITEESFIQSCIIEKNCPQSCSCHLLNKSTIKVNCSARRLLELPDAIPTYTNALSELYLSHNPLQLLSYRSYFTNLSELHLDNCLITSVTPTAIAALQNVRVLALHNNLIKRLPSNTKNITLKRATNVTLHNNRWACSCDSLWLPSWITRHRDVLWMPGRIICNYLEKPVEDFSPSDVSCSFYSQGEVALAMVLALVSIATTVFILCHYGEELNHLLFSKMGLRSRLNFSYGDRYNPYDVFVSYGEDNYKYVIDTLVPRLEEGPRKYKLCLHCRDFPSDMSVMDNIPWAIKLSRCSLLLLSKAFMQKEWCIMDVRTVFQRLLMTANRLIIIVTDDLTPDDVTPDLRAYMSTHEYLQVDEPRFWEKLEMCLPPKISADEDVDVGQRPHSSASGGGDAANKSETTPDTVTLFSPDNDKQFFNASNLDDEPH